MRSSLTRVSIRQQLVTTEMSQGIYNIGTIWECLYSNCYDFFLNATDFLDKFSIAIYPCYGRRKRSLIADVAACFWLVQDGVQGGGKSTIHESERKKWLKVLEISGISIIVSFLPYSSKILTSLTLKTTARPQVTGNFLTCPGWRY